MQSMACIVQETGDDNGKGRGDDPRYLQNPKVVYETKAKFALKGFDRSSSSSPAVITTVAFSFRWFVASAAEGTRMETVVDTSQDPGVSEWRAASEPSLN